ncbi:hypothetical protein THRCLA_02441 [Thraustotheca clavata]|uniref:WRKY19-like zinc finger domain-containing protein n=1 Tax=Thraustotheca clavata TaxID=74557 RepID=A0A1W0A572_9STRA|nr:hypothetical protein THRCLA_02441 [Thraustotheca clavata]
MSIDKLPEAPTLVTRLMRMESFMDEAKAMESMYQPLFMDKTDLLDMEMDPFNFELDTLDLPADDLPTLNFSIACDPSMEVNLDWDMMYPKKPMELAMPCAIESPKATPKRVPLAPRTAPHPNANSFLPLVKPAFAPTLSIKKPEAPAEDIEEAMLSPTSSARKICTQTGCTNRARSHQKCKKHGGARRCTHAGCLKNSQSRGLCIAHGGGSRCRYEGCHRASQSRGLCKSHGGGKFCAVEGCKKKAHLKQLCRMHGGGERCKVNKCMKWAQRKGWCMAHAKELDH